MNTFLTDPNATYRDRIKRLIQSEARLIRSKEEHRKGIIPTFITFLWNRQQSGLSPANVHALKKMIEIGYGAKHRFVCITDDPNGLECETYPLWPDYSELKNLHDNSLVSCYRRLKLFSKWAEGEFGYRRINLDLDCVVTGDLRPLFIKDDPFVGWQVPGTFHDSVYQGSMWMINGSKFEYVWDEFNPEFSPKLTHAAGFGGTDQAWMSMVIGRRAFWNNLDGVYNWKTDLVPRLGILPPSRIVFFPGENGKPWSKNTRAQHPWIKEFYPYESES